MLRRELIDLTREEYAPDMYHTVYQYSWEDPAKFKHRPEGWCEMSATQLRNQSMHTMGAMNIAAQRAGAPHLPWGVLKFPTSLPPLHCVVCYDKKHHNWIMPVNCVHMICVNAAANVVRAAEEANLTPL